MKLKNIEINKEKTYLTFNFEDGMFQSIKLEEEELTTYIKHLMEEL